MNFRSTRFIMLAASFVLGCFFAIAGGYALILPWSTHMQEAAIHLVSERWLLLMLWGLAFILIGIAMILFTALQMRRRLVQIRTGDLAVILDENIIRQYLESYWKKYFPDSTVTYTLTLKKKALYIAADLPYLPKMEQKRVLEEIRDDLNDLFVRLLGYPYDVNLIANFQGDIPKDQTTES